jgi:predicted enzyme related to lactoylglutathione lyase
VTWFEIPVSDIERACKFYGTILDTPMKPEAGMNMPYAFFPMERMETGVGGALSQDSSQKPSQDGTVIYLDCNPDLTAVQARVEAAGGKVLMPKMDISPHGHIALIQDTEGNKIGLHSMA